MQKKDLTATSWFATRATAGLLVLVAAFFAFQPSWLGWATVAAWVGGETRLLGLGVGAAFLLLASLAFEKDRLRVQGAEMLEALNQLLYGKDYTSQREAIGILLTALESRDPDTRRTAHENLVRITGQNFAADPLVWRAWWQASERTWAARK